MLSPTHGLVKSNTHTTQVVPDPADRVLEEAPTLPTSESDAEGPELLKQQSSCKTERYLQLPNGAGR